MQFGDWTLTERSLSWKGKGLQRFDIPASKLNDTRQSKTEDLLLYEYILLATDQDWLTENDLYDLNFAFVFAVGKFNLDFDYDIFDATLAYQFEIFEADDNAEG